MISVVSVASNPVANDIRHFLLIVGIVVWVLTMATAVKMYEANTDNVSLALSLAKDRWPSWVVQTMQ